MPEPKDAEMKIRVTAAMKAGFQKLAAARSTEARTVHESDLAREAFLQYLHGHAAELKDAPSLPPPEPTPPAKPVNYRPPSKKDNDRKALELIKAAAAKKPHPPAPPHPTRTK